MLLEVQEKGTRVTITSEIADVLKERSAISPWGSIQLQTSPPSRESPLLSLLLYDPNQGGKLVPHSCGTS